MIERGFNAYLSYRIVHNDQHRNYHLQRQQKTAEIPTRVPIRSADSRGGKSLKTWVTNIMPNMQIRMLGVIAVCVLCLQANVACNYTEG